MSFNLPNAFSSLRISYQFHQEGLLFLEKITDAYLEKVHSFNFTGHKTPEQFFQLNISDSILPFVENDIVSSGVKNAIDIGTGGGFPGVPLAVLFPTIRWTLSDSVQKKLTLIQIIAQNFGIKNVSTLHGRIEEIAQIKYHREQYDMVTAKALAHWNTLLEYALPLAKVGGHVYLYISKIQEKDLTESAHILQKLGGNIEKVVTYTLPDELGERCLVCVKKIAKTPAAYPRKVGEPKNNPLL